MQAALGLALSMIAPSSAFDCAAVEICEIRERTRGLALGVRGRFGLLISGLSVHGFFGVRLPMNVLALGLEFSGGINLVALTSAVGLRATLRPLPFRFVHRFGVSVIFERHRWLSPDTSETDKNGQPRGTEIHRRGLTEFLVHYQHPVDALELGGYVGCGLLGKADEWLPPWGAGRRCHFTIGMMLRIR